MDQANMFCTIAPWTETFASSGATKSGKQRFYDLHSLLTRERQSAQLLTHAREQSNSGNIAREIPVTCSPRHQRKAPTHESDFLCTEQVTRNVNKFRQFRGVCAPTFNKSGMQASVRAYLLGCWCALHRTNQGILFKEQAQSGKTRTTQALEMQGTALQARGSFARDQCWRSTFSLEFGFR